MFQLTQSLLTVHFTPPRGLAIVHGQITSYPEIDEHNVGKLDACTDLASTYHGWIAQLLRE